MVFRRLFISALLLICTPAMVGAGLLDDLKLPDIKLPGLDALTGGGDPIVSTSLSDAQTEIPYLDSYTPRFPIPLDVLRPNREGIFRLNPGAYEFDAQSYCLHAGTYGPGEGDGYLYAPLKGKKSSIIDSVLKKSVSHPEIPQEEVQMLVWAILARTRISEMNEESQKAASKLLTKAQIKDLQGSALDAIPEDELGDILGKATEPVRRVLEAENSLRQKLTDSTSSYEELEEIAVLTGDHPKGKGSREVPKGRWSYNPEGYFVRYIPTGYTETHMEVYVPERFTIERDDQGRIVSVSDQHGAKIEIAYDETVEPLSFNEDQQTKAYAFKSVTFTEKLPGDTTERKWTNKGWTLVGVPNGNGQTDSVAERFTGWDKRYGKATKLAKEFDDATVRILKSRGAKNTTSSRGSLQEMVDLSHLRTAIDAIISEQELNDAWTANHLDRITNAWQYAFQQRIQNVQVALLPGAYVGLIGAATMPGPGGDGGSDGGAGFSPSGGVATPGDTSQQRLAPSGRPKGDCTPSDSEAAGPLKDALKKHGIDAGDENLDIRESGSGDCRLIRFHVPLGEGNKPLPKLGCAQAAAEGGSVPEGSMESPKKILFGSVQQCGDDTMVNVRTTDLETGEVTGAGRGRSQGTDGSSTESAAGDALGGLGF